MLAATTTLCACAGPGREAAAPDRAAPIARADERRFAASADLPELPELPAPATPGWRVHTFLDRHLYSYGVALRRRGPSPCAGATLLVANGHDHTPQYLSRLATRRSCAPEGRGFAGSATSDAALHFSDVVTGDLDGDGDDEAILAVLGGPDGQPSSGGLILVDQGWRERWIDRGFAASALALGDLDGDGDLDLAVATLWAADEGAGAAPRASACAGTDERSGPPRPIVELLPRGIRGPILIYLQGADGVLRRSLAIPSISPWQLRLADLDLDGDLDLVAAGHEVQVIEGPLDGASHLACERLWGGGPPRSGDYALGVDVAVTAPAGGAPRALVAASAACSDTGACGRLGRSGVWLWERAAAGRGPWRAAFAEIDGIAAALRFSDLAGADPEPALDLVVGRLTAGECEDDARVEGRCIGAPLVALGGAWTAGAYAFAGEDAPRALELAARGQPGRARPMASRILPYAGADALAAAALDRRCYGDRSTSECPCGACPPASAALVTYTGAALVVGVAGVADAGGPLPYRHVYGDRHLTLARRPSGPVTVEWRVVARPGLLVTSASPIAPGGASLFLEIPPAGPPAAAPADPDDHPINYR